MSFLSQLAEEFHDLSREGGWIFWCLVLLAFAIAFSLFSVWQSLISPRLNSGNTETVEADFAKAKRRIHFAFVLIGVAPLIGLLGTVSGMFATFHGMASSSASAPMDVISNGISEALITTQTGLIIAVPTFVVGTMLKVKLNTLNSKAQTELVLNTES